MRYYSKIVRKYTPGQLIFTENDECDGMYIIDTGRVRVFKTVGSGTQTREVELCTLGPKAMFGEMAMIDEHRRSASVQALEPTICTVITKKIFEDQLTRIPPWMVNMIKILVSRLRETNNKLRTIIEQYTAAPYDSGTVLTVDAREAEKVMEPRRQERGGGEEPKKPMEEAKNDGKHAGKDDGKEPENGLPCRISEIEAMINSLFGEQKE